MKQLSVKACSDLLQSKQVSATELAQDYLQHIQNENAAINAFVHLDSDKTLHEAKLADERLQTGMSSLLTGVPIAYKDNFLPRRLGHILWLKNVGKLCRALYRTRGAKPAQQRHGDFGQSQYG